MAPPFSGQGLSVRQSPAYRAAMRRNLAHDDTLPYPFLFLAPEFAGASQDWWIHKLGPLRKRFDDQVIARSILNVP